MADGTQVKIGERHVFPLIKSRIREFESEGINVVLLACTGEFPDIDTDIFLIRPQKVIYHVVSAVSEGLTLGVIVPDKNQVDSAKKRWKSAAAKVMVEYASPYDKNNKIKSAAEKLISG